MATVTSNRPTKTDNPVICVFCGSTPGTNPTHLASARSLAQALHAANATLVYGGGTSGLMGELARTLVSLSGPSSVHGIIPRALMQVERENNKTHTNTSKGQGMSIEQLTKAKSANAALLSESEYGTTTIVPDMHTRKRLMASKVMEGGPGSGFVALAGGYGTIEEVMEMVTWNQLGIHSCPIVLVNVLGYWDGLLAWVGNAVKEGFVGENNRGILVVVEQTEEVMAGLSGYRVAEGRYQLDWS